VITSTGLVGTVAHAHKQLASGVDMLVATGTEAGGHTGRIATMPLVPQIVECVSPLPVIAAGGIGSGRQLAAALALRATGAWVGTAFLLASECAIRVEEKLIIVNGRSEDLGLHKVYTGKPMRGFTNEIIRTWEESTLSVLPVPFEKVLLDDIRYAARKAGRFDLDANPAGQVAGMLTKIRPAAEIV
jgi:nitronate monooxygenase